jgi:hypothetical protein
MRGKETSKIKNRIKENKLSTNHNILWDTSKAGTLIIGYYRNGTHFLQDVINDRVSSIALGEICNNTTITELEELTKDQKQYKICILNNCDPKFYLVNNTDILSKWHVINLTRNNKLEHFISHWFWFQNTNNERFEDSGKFKHHNTNNKVYKNSANTIKKIVPVGVVIQWLQEQLVNQYIKSDFVIDYSELFKLATDNINWQPNQYNDIQLEDVVTNASEIKQLLLNFNLTSKM